MDDEQLQARVRDLRAQGLSTNAITRALDVKRSQVAPLVRALAKEQRQPAAEPPTVRCWVSPGWSAGLSVKAGRDWPDRDRLGVGPFGLSGVLVAHERRRAPGGEMSVCGYLVDAYCLGVKDALGPRSMSRTGLQRFTERFFDGFDEEPIEAPVELVRHLVWGAVAYARGLGFEPHRDFQAAAGHLEPLDGPSAIGFGRDGKPFYTQGPYDDADRIMRTLDAHVGLDHVGYTVRAPLQPV